MSKSVYGFDLKRAFGEDGNLPFYSNCLLKCFYDAIENNTKVQSPVSLKAGDPAMFLAAQQHEERNDEVNGYPAKVKRIRKEAGNTGGDSHQSWTGQKGRRK